MSDSDDLIGQSLREGEYLVREVLGRGGMATVYRAYSRSLETDVAVKVLAPSMAANFELRDRFHQEARLLSRLFHPNLLTVHYFGEEGETVYIAMRLVTGGTLRDRLNAMGGTLDLISAARLVRGVGDALQAAHDAHVVHLDVKPSNVLLGRADWPLLADIGIAEVIEPATATGKRRVAGTPPYMSPEQCRGDAVDGRSDQYSLAVMAYELLTGRVPFTAPTAEETMRQHIEAAPPRPRVINPGLPSPIEDILLRGLEKDPSDRFPTVAEFGRSLAEAAERTRGMSLETKTSLADAAPNAIGVLALLALGPLLLMMLPTGALLGGVVPLGWPFQLAFALGLAALALGVRWHVVGLFVRAANALVDAIERSRGGRQYSALRRALVGSAEGVVNLLYVIGLYRLVGTPLLALLGGVLEPNIVRIVGLVMLGAVVIAVLAIVVGIARSAGLQAAAGVLCLAWILTATVSINGLGLTGATGVISLLRLLVGAGIVAILLANRRRTADLVGGAAGGALGRLMLESHDELPPASVAANRQRLALVTAGVLDLVYLLIAYALLRTPLTDELQLVAPPLVAAAIVTAVAGLVWIGLLVRMRVLAGGLGVLLALLLGAPLLLSLPILDGRIVRDTPVLATSAVAWVLGVALLLLLIAARSRLNDLGRAALGGRMDRGLLGTHAADNETLQQRRQGAFGRLIGAFIDVGLLVLLYWLVGAPIAAALVRSTGQTWISAAALGVLLAAVLGVLALAVVQTRQTLAETGGPEWRARAAALAVLCLLVLPLAAVGGAAAPAALATPAGTGSLELQPVRTPMLVVDWDFWLPWTPDQDEATYQLALSCTDGTRIGEFRETFRPAPGAPMPAGRVGQLGPTGAPCDAWPAEYAARRQAAGLGNTSSMSWDALDVSATVNPDNSVDVVETHRVTFTSGVHDHLAVKIGAPAADLSRLRVTEGGVQYAIDPPEPQPPNYARAWQEGADSWVGWWFPSVDSPAQRTYTIAYRLNGAVHVNQQAGRSMGWRVLPPDPLEPIWMATLEMRLPGDVQSDTIHLQSTGAPVQSGLLDGQAAWFTAAAAIAGQPVDATVAFGGTAPPPPPTATATPVPTSTAPPTATLAPSPLATSVPTGTPAPTQEATPTDEPTLEAATPQPLVATPEPTPPSTPSPTAVASPEATPAPTDTPVDLPTATAVPTPPPTDTPVPATPTQAATVQPTDTPAPATPTQVATVQPTDTPVPATVTPTAQPTDTTVPTPTRTPTRTPSPTATSTPTSPPTPTPTDTPTPTSTPKPTFTPTPTPTATLAPSLQRITIAPANPIIFIGGTQQMTASGFYSDGNTRDLTTVATWHSSDPATISVNAAGVITGLKMGSVTISASVGSVVGSTGATSTSQIT
jgi:serine/threonine-protein kinase